MKRKMMVVGVASMAAALVPVVGAFAETYSNVVVDQVQVTVSTVCNLTSSATPQSAGGPNGTYSKTVTPGTLIGEGEDGQQWDGNANVMTYSCNNANGWKVTAQGVAGVDSSVAQTVLAASSDGTDIDTGTAVSGDVSNWAFKVSGDDAVSGYTSFTTVPGTSAVVSSSEVSGGPVHGSTLTPAYRVWISSLQEADTYTGYVRYILSAPL